MNNNNKKYNEQVNSRICVWEGTITSYTSKHVIVTLQNNEQGICPLWDLSEVTPFQNMSQRFPVNAKLDFMVLFFDKKNNQYVLSYKLIHPFEIKNKTRNYPTLSHDRSLRRFVNGLVGI
ncbi:hypothetical protein [Ureaplasma diversum]|uniref:30S ribosomal protein S1 n=1 Tax=Ureaplasma diversum NCTC 246 TaxID=1188241 RepID=A0A084EXG5_9BACT|nr:hypothetical protein [Ureaplasma diversum]KEZ22657.1 30S ribosomal protein S1 [Ureaplasma diversum NCTC 246]